MPNDFNVGNAVKQLIWPNLDGSDRGWETITSVIDRSDYYVLILAGRYGSVYRRGKSWTEKEYEYAVLRNIPVLAFIRAKRSIRADAMDEDSGLRAKLEGFKRKVRDRHLCREWTREPTWSPRLAMH